MNLLLGLIGNWRAWAILGYIVLSAGVWLQTSRLHSCQAQKDAIQAQFDQFKAQVRLEGEAAQKAANEKAAHDKQAKENADAENRKTLAALHADIIRLRHERDDSHKNLVPAAASSPADTASACFGREALESALRGLLAEIRGLIDEGSEAEMNLNTAKLWAQGLTP